MMTCPSDSALSSVMHFFQWKMVFYNISGRDIMETMTKIIKLSLYVLELLL